MTKKEMYRLRQILDEMYHNRNADTQKTATFDQFGQLYEEGKYILNRTLNKMRPME